MLFGTVHIVDDDESIRRSISTLLETVNVRVCSYASAEDFLSGYQNSDPECLLLDLRMPGMSGMELLDQLNRQHCSIAMIIISQYANARLAVRAIKGGALDVLEKPLRDEELIQCVKDAFVVDARLKQERTFLADILSRIDLLTPRELDVSRRVVSGLPNKVIAAEFGLSQKTIEAHRAKVMKKMKAGSLAELVQVFCAINAATTSTSTPCPILASGTSPKSSFPSSGSPPKAPMRGPETPQPNKHT